MLRKYLCSPLNDSIQSVFNEAAARKQNGRAAVMMAVWVLLLLRGRADSRAGINQHVRIACLLLLRTQLMNLPDLWQLFGK